MIYLIPTDTCYGMACEIADSNEYNKIYEIKQRDPQKPLAIMVGDTMWLRANTDLNFDQLDFLTKYPRPFTVVTRSRIMSHLIHFKDEYLDFHNSDIYDKIGFRVANNEAETKLIEEVGPLFLTSANLSNQPEIYDEEELKKQFGKYIESKQMQVISSEFVKLSHENKPSDVFEFIGNTVEVKYMRKN